ncbi:unnamed protein product [Auanema sp. JU1783]|nr:unnamed protein product [Auanema sp. JU1783]
MKAAIAILMCLLGCTSAGDYGYGAHDGPEHWGDICQNGIRQSPIDIRPHLVDYAVLSRLHFKHYDHAEAIEVTNNGHTVVASGFENWGVHQPSVHGGGLKHSYNLVQLHLHWSHNDHSGSEHKLAGLHYQAELHLVHVRHDLTLKEALHHVDGLAVVAVFLALSHDSEPLSYLAPALEHITQHESNSTIDDFKLRTLLPDNHDAFYRYEGSLTTPTCNEAVIWTVLAEPVSITSKQLKAFRQLQDKKGIPMSHNYRPVQPMNGRRILYRPSQVDRSFVLSILDSTSASSTISMFITVFVTLMYCM